MLIIKVCKWGCIECLLAHSKAKYKLIRQDDIGTGHGMRGNMCVCVVYVCVPKYVSLCMYMCMCIICGCVFLILLVALLLVFLLCVLMGECVHAISKHHHHTHHTHHHCTIVTYTPEYSNSRLHTYMYIS